MTVGGACTAGVGWPLRPRRASGLIRVLALLAGALALQAAVAQPAAAVPGAWGPADSLDDARSSHTATRLYGGNVLVAGGRGPGAPRASSELFNPSTGSWTATAGTLNAARQSHTATLISGAPFQCANFMAGVNNCRKVLVAGGTGPGGTPLASSELFDPASGTWTPTGSLGTARSAHTATLLSRGDTPPLPRAGGEILVVGGLGPGGAPLASAERFDPKTGAWRPAAALATPRYSHTTTVLSNGKVLVVGGRGANDAPLASAELYDPATNTWSPAGSLAAPRSSHTATALGDEISGTSDRRVLVAGGAGQGGTPLASAELYNPTTNTWTAVASLSTARSSHTATVLPDGGVLVAGGSGAGGKLASSELFDPSAGGWAATGSLAAARSSHTTTVLLDGRVLLAGGEGASAAPLASTELYEPALGPRWDPTGSLNQPRSGHTATLIANGEVLVAGGHTFFDASATFNITPLASAERFSPVSGTWTPTGALAQPRSFHTATRITGSPAQCGSNCGKVLVAGGLGATPPPAAPSAMALASAELYDPASGTWAPAAPMLTPRYWHTATRLRDGRILVAAGSDNVRNLDTAEIYNPATNTWTPTGDLNAPPPNPPTDGSPPGARLKHTATLLDNAPCGDNCGKVLVVGGVDGIGTGPSLPTAELYDPASGKWEETARLNQSRQLHTDTLLPNGKVLIAGGFHSPFINVPPHLDAAERYNPVTEEWEPTGFMGNRRMFHTASLLPDGTVLAAGGSAGGNAPGFPYIPGPGLFSSELYLPDSNQWSGTRFMNTARVLHTATQLPSEPPSLCGTNCGKVLVVGGEREIVGNFPPYFLYRNPLGSAELYTPARPTDGVPPAPTGPTPTTPTPTPIPTPKPTGRVRPNMVRPRVSARQRGNQIIVRVRGRMVGVRGRPCSGRVKVGLRLANRRRGLRTVRMSSACRYKATLRSSVRGLPRRVRPRRRVLIARVTARFQGNSRLRTDLSPTRRAKVRR